MEKGSWSGYNCGHFRKVLTVIKENVALDHNLTFWFPKVQAHVTSDDEDDLEELLNNENETKLDEFEYKDEESEDEELLEI